jgi:hypothetical protein
MGSCETVGTKTQVTLVLDHHHIARKTLWRLFWKLNPAPRCLWSYRICQCQAQPQCAMSCTVRTPCNSQDPYRLSTSIYPQQTQFMLGTSPPYQYHWTCMKCWNATSLMTQSTYYKAPQMMVNWGAARWAKDLKLERCLTPDPSLSHYYYNHRVEFP